jgi:hypothetical protein
VDVRTGSPDPDKPSRALPAAGDSETEILDIEQPPKCDGRTGAVGKVEPATGGFHAAACWTAAQDIRPGIGTQGAMSDA